MRKVLFGAVALFTVLAVLRRFGPNLEKRAMEKCQEMMTGARQERGFVGGGQEPAPSMAR